MATENIKLKILSRESIRTYDDLANELFNDNPVYALGIQGDCPYWLRVLAEQLEVQHRCGIHFNNNRESATIHIASVHYENSAFPDQDRAKARVKSYFELFYRWTAAGFNKNRAKAPEKSKAFRSFLTDEYFRVSFVVFLAPDNPAEDSLRE